MPKKNVKHMDYNKKFAEIIEKNLQEKVEAISDTEPIEKMPSFDSFSALMIFTDLEETFGISFTPDELRNFKSLRDIKSSLRDKGVMVI